MSLACKVICVFSVLATISPRRVCSEDINKRLLSDQLIAKWSSAKTQSTVFLIPDLLASLKLEIANQIPIEAFVLQSLKDYGQLKNVNNSTVILLTIRSNINADISDPRSLELIAAVGRECGVNRICFSQSKLHGAKFARCDFLAYQESSEPGIFLPLNKCSFVIIRENGKYVLVEETLKEPVLTNDSNDGLDH